MIFWLIVMLAAIVGSAWVFGAWGWLWVRIRRLEEGRGGTTDSRLLRELDQLREQVASTEDETRRLAERIEFLERLLEARQGSDPARRLPGGSEGDGPMLRFDVFGRLIGITRTADGWRPVYLGADGKRREATDVFIPASIPESELPRYLADLFHELATPEKPEVIRLDVSDSSEQGR